MPLWTAFITQQVALSKWIIRQGPRSVRVVGLRRHVFTNEYIPGDILHFATTWGMSFHNLNNSNLTIVYRSNVFHGGYQ